MIDDPSEPTQTAMYLRNGDNIENTNTSNVWTTSSFAKVTFYIFGLLIRYW